MIAGIEIYYYYANGEFAQPKMKLTYLIFVVFVISDLIIGYKNLIYKTLEFGLTDEELNKVIVVMEKTRNWKIINQKFDSVDATCYNPKYLLNDTLSTNIKIEKDQTKIVSYLTPSFIEPNTSTAGDRDRNIKYFELAAQFVKQNKELSEIPNLIKEHLEKEENDKDEFSFELMKKRLLAYSIIIGLFFVPYMYRDSFLFVPFLVFPLIGIGYIIIDLMTIKSKSSR